MVRAAPGGRIESPSTVTLALASAWPSASRATNARRTCAESVPEFFTKIDPSARAVESCVVPSNTTDVSIGSTARLAESATIRLHSRRMTCMSVHHGDAELEHALIGEERWRRSVLITEAQPDMMGELVEAVHRSPIMIGRREIVLPVPGDAEADRGPGRDGIHAYFPA